jgi:molybdopterin-dependent oxidoreductase alpha subunit
MHEGKVKVFMGLGGNFHSATPDTDFTCEALQRCELTVQVSTKLNRGHLITGKTALILPCLARTDKDRQQSGEQKVSVENSMGVVHSSQGVLRPVSKHLKSEVAIVTGIAEALWGEEWPWKQWCDNYDHIRDLIADVIPGFKDYNRRLQQPQGFYLPNVAREGSFKSGKAHFTVVEVPKHQLDSGEYMMMTVRSHDQFNTTIYGLDDRYRGLQGDRRVVLMNPEDMKEAGLTPEEVVDITSNYDRERRVLKFRVVAYDIPRGNIASYFPETNPLVPYHQVARKSHTPISKSIRVRIHKR